MQARVKPLVLPEAPKYTGNTGKPLDSDIEVEYAHGLALGAWHRHRS